MVNPLPYIKKAVKNGYAIPHFNVYDLETAKAAVETAASLKSPVILAFTVKSIVLFGLQPLIGVVNGLEKMYGIPVAAHFDHYTDPQLIKEGIDLGIKSVMIDASKKSFVENVRITKEIVDYAKGKDVCVEAEVGIIGGVEDNLKQDEKEAQYSSPEEVKKFIALTNVDTLAASVGTAHGIYKSEPDLRFSLIENIIKCSPKVLLVLHGGSGLTERQFRQAIRSGIAKVNVGTGLKKPFADGIKNCWKLNPLEDDPRIFMQAGIDNLKPLMEYHIKLFGSNNTL